MKKTLLIFIGLFLSINLFSQGLINQGAKIVVNSGGYIYIDGGTNGNYVNNSTSEIDLDGTIILEGNFTNNATNNVFRNVDNDGEIKFAGVTQSITSALPNFTNFEKVTVQNTSTTSLLAGSGMTSNGTFTINGNFISETPTNENIGGSIITTTGAGAVTGIGTLTIKRFFNVSSRWQYISVPMTGQKSDIFTEQTVSGNFNPNLYSYNETYDEPIDPTNTDYSNYDYASGYGFWQAWQQIQAEVGTPVTLNAAIGYITYNENNVTANFSGLPNTINNNASYSPTLTFTPNDDVADITDDFYDGWNLIGNPYQSAINWNDLTKSNILNTVYLWDGDAVGGGNYVYYNNAIPDDYIFGDGQTLNSSVSAQYIPAMQSFMVKATVAAPSITIPATARTHKSNQLLKNEPKIFDYDFVKLQIKSNELYDQTLVRFFESDDVTSDLDENYDAYKAFATTPNLPQIYSLVNEIPIAINSLPLLTEEDYSEIPLGVVIKQSNNYTFSAEELNTLNFKNLYLIDKISNENIVYTDLISTSEYSTYLYEGENRNRFFLLGIKNPNINIENIYNKTSCVNIYSANSKLYISITDEKLIGGEFYMYDALGKLVFSGIANDKLNMYDLNLVQGVYVVKFSSDTFNFSNKVIF